MPEPEKGIVKPEIFDCPRDDIQRMHGEILEFSLRQMGILKLDQNLGPVLKIITRVQIDFIIALKQYLEEKYETHKQELQR